MVGADKSSLELSDCFSWLTEQSALALSGSDGSSFLLFSSSLLRMFQCFRDAPCFLVFRGHCANLRQLALTALRVFVDVSGVFASFCWVFEFVSVLFCFVFFVLFEAGGIIFEFSSIFLVFFWFSSSFLGVYQCFRYLQCFSSFSRPVELPSSFRRCSHCFSSFLRVFFEFSGVIDIFSVFRVFRGPWNYLRVFVIFVARCKASGGLREFRCSSIIPVFS